MRHRSTPAPYGAGAVGANGRLGNGNTAYVLSPPAAGTAVDSGPALAATAISAGYQHTCAILTTARSVLGATAPPGRLGYGNQATMGDNERGPSAGAVDIGAGRRAVAISAG